MIPFNSVQYVAILPDTALKIGAGRFSEQIMCNSAKECVIKINTNEYNLQNELIHLVGIASKYHSTNNENQLHA